MGDATSAAVSTDDQDEEADCMPMDGFFVDDGFEEVASADSDDGIEREPEAEHPDDRAVLLHHDACLNMEKAFGDDLTEEVTACTIFGDAKEGSPDPSPEFCCGVKKRSNRQRLARSLRK